MERWELEQLEASGAIEKDRNILGALTVKGFTTLAGFDAKNDSQIDGELRIADDFHPATAGAIAAVQTLVTIKACHGVPTAVADASGVAVWAFSDNGHLYYQAAGDTTWAAAI